MPDPNANKKKKDKGKRRVDTATSEAARPKHRRVEESSDLAVPSAIVVKDFLFEEIRPSQLMSSDLLSEQGHRMLDSAAPSAQWAMACELQVRATAILRKLALEPMADIHNLRKSLEETKAAFQESLEAHEATSNEKLNLEAEVARLKEAVGEMEGRALAAEDAERMRVQEMKEVLAREAQIKAGAEASLTAFRADCENKIIKEHEAGFMHAVRQATHFGTFPPNFSFELSKDFFQEAYMDFADAPDVEPDEVARPRSTAPEDPGTTLNDDEETEQTTNAD
ncbi:uncharacterized protein LOC114915560 [Cajanus cajan]|uniref:uncharacterized protein LOC114915560 n=1 Tax=Cajanus cajan TaxID=3821 RepID=UPI0010FB9316|nr:uncharacterized protein LOC114915560 [Cajanus cajan]